MFATAKLVLVAAASAAALALTANGVVAKTPEAPKAAVTGFASIALSDLPKQGQDTHKLILLGGPFPYGKDGSVFGNREKILPKEKRGFYREYTVKTPFSRDRGARRIVCGGLKPAAPEACYYTADQYASFKLSVVK